MAIYAVKSSFISSTIPQLPPSRQVVSEVPTRGDLWSPRVDNRQLKGDGLDEEVDRGFTRGI